MPPSHRQHVLVITAIASLAGHPFSGFEVARRTGIPRSTVSRIMSTLQAMGLLEYRPLYNRATWRVTSRWSYDIDKTVREYELWHRNRGATALGA